MQAIIYSIFLMVIDFHNRNKSVFLHSRFGDEFVKPSNFKFKKLIFSILNKLNNKWRDSSVG